MLFARAQKESSGALRLLLRVETMVVRSEQAAKHDSMHVNCEAGGATTGLQLAA
jgi:hypothetical protein